MSRSFLKTLIKLISPVLFFLLLSWSISNNSIAYHVDLNERELKISVFNQQFQIQNKQTFDFLNINLIPQNRFSTSQFLIQNRGSLLNGLQILELFILGKKAPEIIYKQQINTSKDYIHFHPFRAALNIAQENTHYTLQINIPDSSLEIWSGSSKTNTYNIKPPWLKLILFPLLSPLLLAGILFYSLTFLLKITGQKFISSISNRNIKNERITLASALIIFFLGAILIGFIFVRVFKAMPGFGDEMNYLIQAKIFASGKIYATEPFLPEFFRVNWMDIFGNDKKLWNFQPIGNSLVLALGWLSGIRWITIPLVGGFILLTQYLIALNLFNNQGVAFLSVILMATSHYFLSLASSFMAHAPCLLFVSLSYLFIIKFFKNRNQHYLIPASFFMGLAFITRPLSAVLSTIVPALAILYYLLKSKKIDYSSLFSALMVGLVTSSVIFVYTYFITGHWTLPYLMKGPEVGLTFFVRLGKELNYHLTNLYRNQNEFQNRVHSFGIFFNYLFFLLPLFFIKRDKNKLFILGGHLSFWFYLISHSFLHWYGWKWEPRMLYEISFIFFILSASGFWLFYQNIKQIKLTKYATVLFGLTIFLRTAFVDLPNRFKTEYKNYNFTPTGVRDMIAKRKISNAIIFFANEFLFAPYSPDNSLTFDGNIIYAISQGNDYNYRLVSKFPEKRVFFSPDAQTLLEKPNFYREDVYKLRDDLINKYQNYQIINVIPWLKIAETNLNNLLPGRKVDQSEFITLLRNNFANASTKNQVLIVLIGQSTNLAEVVKNLYSNSIIINKNEYETSIKFQIIDLNSRINSLTTPGIKMTCYDGINWNGRIIKQEIVGEVDASQCYGNYRSIIWEANFNLLKTEKVTFYLESDDGSAIIVDGKAVIDNNLSGTHGLEKKIETVNLHEGRNNLIIKYFNGPGVGFINAGIINSFGQEEKISLKMFSSFFYLSE